MDTLKSADVIIADFPGVTGIKRRPAVVISTMDYHTTVGDVILGAVTTNLTIATTPTDHLIADWAGAGLRRPSAFEFPCNTSTEQSLSSHWVPIIFRLAKGAGMHPQSNISMNTLGFN